MDKNENVSKQFTVFGTCFAGETFSSQGFAGSEVTVTGAHLNPEILEKRRFGVAWCKSLFPARKERTC